MTSKENGEPVSAEEREQLESLIDRCFLSLGREAARVRRLATNAVVSALAPSAVRALLGREREALLAGPSSRLARKMWAREQGSSIRDGLRTLLLADLVEASPSESRAVEVSVVALGNLDVLKDAEGTPPKRDLEAALERVIRVTTDRRVAHLARETKNGTLDRGALVRIVNELDEMLLPGRDARHAQAPEKDPPKPPPLDSQSGILRVIVAESSLQDPLGNPRDTGRVGAVVAPPDRVGYKTSIPRKRFDELHALARSGELSLGAGDTSRNRARRLVEWLKKNGCEAKKSIAEGVYVVQLGDRNSLVMDFSSSTTDRDAKAAEVRKFQHDARRDRLAR